MPRIKTGDTIGFVLFVAGASTIGMPVMPGLLMSVGLFFIILTHSE